MFTPPRFVVVDDNAKHAHAIAACIQELGSACATVIYSLEKDVPVAAFLGARVVFMDLQLMDRAHGDFKRHYAEIQRILSQVINPVGGPYMLVLWTEVPERADELRGYLEEHLYAKSPHTRPLSLLALSKNDYIDSSTESATNSAELGNRIRIDMAEATAVAALLQWESDVLHATNGVLQTVISAASTASGGPVEVSAVLKRIAIDAVGESQALADPESAVHIAMLPLLHDQIQDTASRAGSVDVWNNAYEGAPEPLPKLSREKAAKLNSHLHLQLATNGDVTPTSWGALSSLEPDFSWADFGFDGAKQFVEKVVQKQVQTQWLDNVVDMEIDDSNTRRVRVGQVRIGAACDFAQKAHGPIPFVLAAFIPVRKDHAAKKPVLADRSTAWMSPLMDIGEWGRGHLFVDPRFSRTRGHQQAQQFTPVARIREQLLIELISTVSHHGARPGITQFEGEDSP
ncbi:hypothetical protein [Leifsonia sp. A12D58]|uniref:hypothetical protein n=1 Tax=Leifsonia sp. A12D58 TaxID=3397674 RepID=UPI0039E1F54A